MKFASRSNGTHYPINHSTGGGVSSQAFHAVSSQDGHRHRTVSKKEKSRLTSLENPLLYKNFKEKLERLNPDLDIESLIDKTLEPEEALFDIKKHHPEIDIGLKSEGQNAEFREFLDEFGITNERVQNLVAQQEVPLSENELAQLSYILNSRPPNAVETDKGLKAPVTRDIRAWMAKPNRLDLAGTKF